MAKSLKTKMNEFENFSLDQDMVFDMICELTASGKVWSAGMMYWQLAQKYINAGQMNQKGESLI